jgi:predicted peptidase
LPSNVESIKTCQDKLVIFGSKQVRVLNGKTGLVEFEYEMKHAKCMWVSNNCYLITFNNKGCFMFFDLNEQKKLGYVSLSKHVYDFKYKHVSNEKLILFNENSFKVHSLD